MPPPGFAASSKGAAHLALDSLMNPLARLSLIHFLTTFNLGGENGWFFWYGGSFPGIISILWSHGRQIGSWFASWGRKASERSRNQSGSLARRSSFVSSGLFCRNLLISASDRHRRCMALEHSFKKSWNGSENKCQIFWGSVCPMRMSLYSCSGRSVRHNLLIHKNRRFATTNRRITSIGRKFVDS